MEIDKQHDEMDNQDFHKNPSDTKGMKYEITTALIKKYKQKNQLNSNEFTYKYIHAIAKQMNTTIIGMITFMDIANNNYVSGTSNMQRKIENFNNFLSFAKFFCCEFVSSLVL